MEEQRQRGEEERARERERDRERERERDREGTEIKLFPSGGSGSLPSFAEKLHKNRSDDGRFSLTQWRLFICSFQEL